MLSPLVPEDLQHGGVPRQNIGDQFLEPGVAGDGHEVAHQRRADALSLVGIVHGEGDLGLAGRPHDVAAPADDHRLAVLFQHRDQGDVAHEIDIEIEVDLLVREAAFEGEEAPVEGLIAGAADGGEQPGPVLRPEGADFDRASVAQGLGG